MKTVSTITALDAPNESLATYLARGTALRLCLNILRQPVVTRSGAYGSADMPMSFVGTRMEVLNAKLETLTAHPAILFICALMRFLGFHNEAATDPLEEIDAELADIEDTARYWTHAIQTLVAHGKAIRAKGKRFVFPDWFVWLQYFGIAIKPARLRAIMAAMSEKGRIAVMGFLDSDLNVSPLTETSARCVGWGWPSGCTIFKDKLCLLIEPPPFLKRAIAFGVGGAVALRHLPHNWGRHLDESSKQPSKGAIPHG